MTKFIRPNRFSESPDQDEQHALSKVKSGCRLRSKKSDIRLVTCTPRYLNSSTYCNEEEGATWPSLSLFGKRIDLDQLICIPEKVPNMSTFFRAAESDGPTYKHCIILK